MLRAVPKTTAGPSVAAEPADTSTETGNIATPNLKTADDDTQVATTFEIVDHVTGEGKTIRGVVRTDLTTEQAKGIETSPAEGCPAAYALVAIAKIDSASVDGMFLLGKPRRVPACFPENARP